MARLVAGDFAIDTCYGDQLMLRRREYYLWTGFRILNRGRPLLNDALGRDGRIWLCQPWACQIIPALDLLAPDGVRRRAGYDEPNAWISFVSHDRWDVQVELGLCDSVFGSDDDDSMQSLTLHLEPDWPAVRAFHAALRAEFKTLAQGCALWRMITSETDPWRLPTPEFLAGHDWVRRLVEA